jgi:hypothetical protein
MEWHEFAFRAACYRDGAIEESTLDKAQVRQYVGGVFDTACGQPLSCP